jgi:hypothetical protein
LVSTLGREFVCFESRDAVVGIHLSALDIARPLFDARLMDGVWIGDLPGGRSNPVRVLNEIRPEPCKNIAVLRALLARGWNGGN